QQMFYLCESEATATNVLSVRKRSDSNKCFICGKAKQQQQMFYLCESEAAATNVLSVRKRSVSNKCLSVRKRSVSNKAPSRNGNQPHVMVMSHFIPVAA
ncbi:hypothetical protein, partial [Lysinibacillus sp. NPDC056232]|uniref:hypothetical protein n=1 Tax=Lysinibacillus sp. NPDC056232 TaxID=3345756 RepID=UPI0035D584C5